MSSGTCWHLFPWALLFEFVILYICILITSRAFFLRLCMIYWAFFFFLLLLFLFERKFLLILRLIGLSSLLDRCFVNLFNNAWFFFTLCNRLSLFRSMHLTFSDLLILNFDSTFLFLDCLYIFLFSRLFPIWLLLGLGLIFFIGALSCDWHIFLLEFHFKMALICFLLIVIFLLIIIVSWVLSPTIVIVRRGLVLVIVSLIIGFFELILFIIVVSVVSSASTSHSLLISIWVSASASNWTAGIA